jgi:hypothetical protein
VSIVNVGIRGSFSCRAGLAALRVMTWITPVGFEVKSNLHLAPKWLPAQLRVAIGLVTACSLRGGAQATSGRKGACAYWGR